MENQDDFDQKRFLAAMVLSGIVLVVWQAFFAPPPEPPKTGEEVEVTQQVEKTEPQQVAANTNGEPTADTPPTVPVKLDVIEPKMKTKDFEVDLSTRGARVIGVHISEPEQYQAEGDLLKSFPDDSDLFPFGIYFTKNSIPLKRGQVWQFVDAESTKDGDNYSKVVFRHADPGGQFEIDKIYSLQDHTWMLDLEVVVRNKGKAAISDRLAIDITGYSDPNVDKPFLDMRPSGDESICKLEDDLERELFDALKEPEGFDESPVMWSAIGSHYFLFAAVPATPGVRCQMERVDDDYIRTRLVQDDFLAQPGQSISHKYQLWMGPKDYDQLSAFGSNLEESVDFGILTFLARPLRWLLVVFFGFLGNWGLAIILLTLVIRVLTWPINQKVYVNSEKMKEVQPILQAIKEKYPDDQQRAAEETMKVWKEHGVSPLGCAPMLLQFPILLALYFMILYSVELYHADFAFWYTDLSAPDPYFVLPILMGIVMVVQQKFMTPAAGGNEQMQQMQTMMKIMPVMFTAFMLFLPSGVVLYYLVSLLLGLIQQYMIKRAYANKKAKLADS